MITCFHSYPLWPEILRCNREKAKKVHIWSTDKQAAKKNRHTHINRICEEKFLCLICIGCHCCRPSPMESLYIFDGQTNRLCCILNIKKKEKKKYSIYANTNKFVYFRFINSYTSVVASSLSFVEFFFSSFNFLFSSIKHSTAISNKLDQIDIHRNLAFFITRTRCCCCFFNKNRKKAKCGHTLRELE